MNPIDDPCFGDNVDTGDFSDYCAQFMACERLRLLREPGEKGFDGSRYFREHFFILDSWKETFRLQDKIEGTRMYELLTMERRLEDLDSPSQQEAQSFVHELLAQSATAKFGAGFWRPGMPLTLTSYWAKPGHEDDDSIPGTWGGFLRYGSLYLEQKRDHGRCLTPMEIPEEKDVVITAGYLEPAK